MHQFWLCFFPLFIAVDALGVLPMFMSFTHALSKKQRHTVVIQSVFTAIVVATAFLAIGQGILKLLHITVSDFMIAGGILLFVIAMSEMLHFEKNHSHLDAESLGAVPIGVPLIVGPAVLTTSLILISQYGILLTGFSVLINILIAGLVFWFSGHIYRFLGRVGSKTISKLAALLIAAIAVMMIRKGIILLITTTQL
jgi:multiple antibiotic resistance protein